MNAKDKEAMKAEILEELRGEILPHVPKSNTGQRLRFKVEEYHALKKEIYDKFNALYNGKSYSYISAHKFADHILQLSKLTTGHYYLSRIREDQVDIFLKSYKLLADVCYDAVSSVLKNEEEQQK